MKLVLMLIALIPVLSAFGQQQFSGKIYDQQSGLEIADVNIYEQDSGSSTVTDSTGGFSIRTSLNRVTLRFTKMGYQSYTRTCEVSDSPIRVFLNPGTIDIEAVEINTGYQWIPKERATGSFVHVDRAQLEAIPGRSVIDKLDGIMPGLQFDNRRFNVLTSVEPTITVRGMNSFNSNASRPLIIVDNFPYEGDLENINPNDVESVTMLRDAAATSIWGARAGNGVLVINLKKPEQSGRTVVNWSSNLSITPKPDLYLEPVMNSSEFIDVELFLYDQNYYRAALNSPNAYRLIFSPVVQALHDLDMGKISQAEVDGILADARTRDYRDDMMKYFYRDAVNQQHHVSLSKRTGDHNLRFSAGIDRLDGVANMASDRSNTRYAFNLNNSYQFSQKLFASLDVSYTFAHNHNEGAYPYPLGPGGGKSNMYPYVDLVDEQGNGLIVPKDLNPRFIDTAGRGHLLDWTFNPYEDMPHTLNESRTSRINPNLTLRYSPIRQLHLEAIYSGTFQQVESSTRYGVDSYSVRDDVNRYTQINGDQVIRPIPVGDILAYGHSDLSAHKMRFHARMDEQIFDRDRLSWILGGEVSDVQTTRSAQNVYGYDDFLTSSIPVDHVIRHPLYVGSSASISSGQSFGRGTQRLVSFYGNASYVIHGKYIATASARRDASNVFGAKANERWNPLWSVGLAWNLHEEDFLSGEDWISNLKLRITQGHSGNLGGGTTSDRVVIANNGNSQYTGLPSMRINSPPNTSLRWENVQINNYAVDFGLFMGKLTGSLEYYKKRVTDLISTDPIDLTTGFRSMDKNVGGIDGEGIDFALNISPFQGVFQWKIGTSFSYARDWVTVYKGNISAASSFISGETAIRPVVGRSLMSIYSYRFAGLDPETGDPRGYLDGEVSKNYSLMSRDSLHNLNYHGSARPLYFGFVNNSFQYRNLSLFVNVAFRAGHYFRKNTINYQNLFNSWNTHSDYSKRWQQPGDELHTAVPSMVYPAVAARESFYAGSEANVERGDVIRLQQIRLSYRWIHPFWRVRSADIGVHVNNLGIIWKASDTERDPDYQGIPPTRIVSTSIRFQF